jgi:hypothetical protein
LNLRPDYEAQLGDEYLRKEKGETSGTASLAKNHIADCEKMQLILPA